MEAKYIHEGKSIDYTPATDVEIGQVVVQGDLVGVALHSIEANRLGALQVSGVFRFPKATGSALAVGTKVYWDESAKQATDDDDTGSNKYLGKVVATAATADDSVLVRLSQ